jgi:type IV pilus assembly protein PilA
MNIKNQKLNIKNNRGFTLIEMLVVIGIIAILAAVVLVAVNPLRQFASARDSQRRSDLYALTNAIYQFAVEHNGNLPSTTTTPATTADIPDCTNPAVDYANDGLDAGAALGLDNVLVPTYVANIPFDPTDTDGDGNTTTNYRICVQSATGSTGRIVAIAAQEVTTDGSSAYITVTR